MVTPWLKALVIPHDAGEPMKEVELPPEDGLELLQGLVGGDIEALALPPHLDPDGMATGYVHEEGKYARYVDPGGFAHEGLPVNERATKLMMPGVGLFAGDWIAGDFVLVGFDVSTGEHAELPNVVRQNIAALLRPT